MESWRKCDLAVDYIYNSYFSQKFLINIVFSVKLSMLESIFPLLMCNVSLKLAYKIMHTHQGS